MSADAPGRLDEIRALVNTYDFETGSDPLRGPDTLEQWWEQTSPVSLNAEQAARLRSFREALRALLEANAGHGDAAAAWEGVQPFLEQARFVMRVGVDGVPVLAPQGEGPDAVITGMLAIVYDAVGSGTWPRLKACRNRTCRYAFYDRSKNGAGTWCDMAVCGNRAKAQRRRARQKSSRNR